MAPYAGLDPVDWPIAARLWRHRRALTVCAMLAVAYVLVYRWVDGFEVPPVIAASDPNDEPETRWRLASDPLPEGAAGLYYVPGVGILPVTSNARWTDVVDGRVAVLFQDRLNTWTQRVDLVQLPFLPPYVRVSDKEIEPSIHLWVSGSDRDDSALSTDAGGWSMLEKAQMGSNHGSSGQLPDEAHEVIVRGRTWGSITLPIRSPERMNAVRAERAVLPSARDGVTVAVAAVAAWPGGTAIRLEGVTDDPEDVVLLGLDVAPGWGNGDWNDQLAADPAGAVVLRDDRGRTYRLRNEDSLGRRRGPFQWAMWLGNGHGSIGTKPGIDLPATLVFDALPVDAKALTLSVGPIRIAHDMLLPEDADRPSEGEARETLAIPVPDDVPPYVARAHGNDYSGFEAPLDDVPLVLAGSRVVARSARFAPEGIVVIELVNDAPSAGRRLVDVFAVPERWRRAAYYDRFHGSFMRGTYDAGAGQTVRVVARGGPRWPEARATAFATAGAAAQPGDIPWPPRDARPFTVALVRPVVELGGRWTFELPMDALRSNAATNSALRDDVATSGERR